jgi:hypothetical protein
MLYYNCQRKETEREDRKMMREETRRNIELLREKVGNGIFRSADTKGLVSISTLRKYDLIKSAVERTEVSLDELIDEINDMIGEDCYCAVGYFERVGDKIYFCNDEDRYIFK